VLWRLPLICILFTIPFMKQSFFSRNALFAFGSLGFASAVCVMLVIARWYRTQVADYKFMIWNLILAWIPFIVAYIAYRLHRAHQRRTVLIAACTLVWLLFLPNAPYLLTDLIHLRYRSDALMWYDLMLMLWFVWTGLMLGFGSIYLMQQIIADSFGEVTGWLFALASITVTSFGIYLGRFLRWNSWDVVSEPGALLADIYHLFRHPIANIYTHMFWLLLAVLLIFVYVLFTTLPSLRQQPD
jgi:uncharacterized membrane protein